MQKKMLHEKWEAEESRSQTEAQPKMHQRRRGWGAGMKHPMRGRKNSEAQVSVEGMGGKLRDSHAFQFFMPQQNNKCICSFVEGIHSFDVTDSAFGASEGSEQKHALFCILISLILIMRKMKR